MSTNEAQTSITIDVRFEGSPGKSLFQHLIQECISEKETSEIQAQIDTTVEHVKEYDDDRLLVLVGALLVENAVDRLLASFMPGYKALQEKSRDFTFSMRIELARALQLIPNHILSAADAIRDVRNKFAHVLEINTFAALGKNKGQALRDHLRNFSVIPEQDWDEADIFGQLVIVTTMALYLYKPHTQWLNEYVRSSSFMKTFSDYCTARRKGEIPNEVYRWDPPVRVDKKALGDSTPKGEQKSVPIIVAIRNIPEYQLTCQSTSGERIFDDNPPNHFILYKPTGERIGTTHDIVIDRWSDGIYPQEPGHYSNLPISDEAICVLIDGKLHPVDIRVSITVEETMYFGYIYCARGKMKIFPERNAYVECAALFLSSEISFF
ncbi:MAG: hypothetical protein L0229_21750, partial [Blastocatellia bacterium]|nr:hypothetical protein [Blastocatellia bacterium]